MRLKLFLPTEILLDCITEKIIAEGIDGLFCLLPKHIDFVSTLVTGIMTYVSNNKSHYIAHSEGILVKRGNNVYISTIRAIIDDSLDNLVYTVDKKFQILDEKEKEAKTAIAKLEAKFTKLVIELAEE